MLALYLLLSSSRLIFLSSSFSLIFFFFSDGFVSFIYSTPFGFLVEEKKRTGDIPLVYHFVPTSAQRRRRRQDCNKLLNRMEGKKNLGRSSADRGALMSYEH
jgi:hypothetical protein